LVCFNAKLSEWKEVKELVRVRKGTLVVEKDTRKMRSSVMQGVGVWCMVLTLSGLASKFSFKL
jgi:hypothetical protein